MRARARQSKEPPSPKKRVNKQSLGGKPREEKKEQPTQLIEKMSDDVYVATTYHFHGVNKLKPYVSQKV